MERGKQELNKFMYRVDELCKLTGFGKTKLYDELKSGNLKSIKCGRMRLIPATEVDAWMARMAS